VTNAHAAAERAGSIQVLVWARPAITRAGLEAIVRADPRFEVAGAGPRPADLWTALRQFTPNVVLIDSGDTPGERVLPGLPPPAAFPALALPAIVVLLETTRRADILRVLQAGVRAIIARDAYPGEITAALEAAHDGLAVFSPEILDLLLPNSTELAGAGELPPGEPLSQRESDVLALMAEGAGNKEIAARLHISENTVKFHVSSILNKLGAATRTEAVTRGYKEGLILM
jgi:DNA-binding NarL/FixJ family response regulator